MEFPVLLSLLVMLQFSDMKTATPKPINWYKLAAGNHFILNTVHINIIHICKSLLVVARDRTTENYHVNHLIFFSSQHLYPAVVLKLPLRILPSTKQLRNLATINLCRNMSPNNYC